MPANLSPAEAPCGLVPSCCKYFSIPVVENVHVDRNCTNVKISRWGRLWCFLTSKDSRYARVYVFSPQHSHNYHAHQRHGAASVSLVKCTCYWRLFVVLSTFTQADWRSSKSKQLAIVVSVDTFLLSSFTTMTHFHKRTTGIPLSWQSLPRGV